MAEIKAGWTTKENEHEMIKIRLLATYFIHLNEYNFLVKKTLL